MISKHIIEKSKEIRVELTDNTESKLYFKCVYFDKNLLKHIYSVKYFKDKKALIDRFDCSCVSCSLNPFEQKICSYIFAVIRFMIKEKMLHEDLLKTIEE